MSIFTEAVEVLIIRRTQKARPRDPNAYAVTLRKDLLYRLQDDAKAILAEQPDLTAVGLADLLDPGSNVTPEVPEQVGPPQPEHYEPEPWEPLDAEALSLAKERIAAIKRDVLGGAS